MTGKGVSHYKILEHLGGALVGPRIPDKLGI